MSRPPRIPANLHERTARRSVPAIFCQLCQLALEGGILSPSAQSRPEKDFLNRRIRSDFSVDLAWMGSDNPFVVA